MNKILFISAAIVIISLSEGYAQTSASVSIPVNVNVQKNTEAAQPAEVQDAPTILEGTPANTQPQNQQIEKNAPDPQNAIAPETKPGKKNKSNKAKGMKADGEVE